MEEFDAQLLKSWEVSQDVIPGEKYLFHKLYSSGVDIIISIKEINNTYEIRSSAVANVAGPDETLVGSTNSLAEAIKITKAECIWWDEYLEKFQKKKP